MKMVMMVVDGGRSEELEIALEEAGVTGFTEIQHAVGVGARGPRLGSRAFPRTSSVIFSFVPDETLEPLRRRLRELCGACGEHLKLAIWDAEEMGSAP